VAAATNCPFALNGALLRPGRFDIAVHVNNMFRVVINVLEDVPRAIRRGAGPGLRGPGSARPPQAKLELELIQPHMAQKPVLNGVKWGARVLRVRSVSREKVWAKRPVLTPPKKFLYLLPLIAQRPALVR